MTAASLLAAAHSSRDSRLPVTTSMRGLSGLSRKVSSLSTLPERLAKQRRLQNPRSSKSLTTRAPMKPLAPVMRITSCRLTIKDSPSAQHPLPLLSTQFCMLVRVIPYARNARPLWSASLHATTWDMSSRKWTRRLHLSARSKGRHLGFHGR